MGAFANEPWVAPSRPELYLRLRLSEICLLDDLHFAIQTSFWRDRGSFFPEKPTAVTAFSEPAVQERIRSWDHLPASAPPLWTLIEPHATSC